MLDYPDVCPECTKKVRWVAVDDVLRCPNCGYVRYPDTDRV